MSIHTKSASIIIITLLIGILVGVLGRGSFQPGPSPPGSRPDNNIRPQTFVEHFQRILDVKGENKDSVRILLEYHFEYFRALNTRHRKELDSLMEALFIDLEPLLNEDELQRMENDRDKMRYRPKDGPAFGPPGGHPPPPRDGHPPPFRDGQPPSGDSPPPPPQEEEGH